MDKNKEKTLGGIKFIEKTETNYLIKYITGEKGKLTLLNDHVFEYQMSPNGEFSKYPKIPNTNEEAKIIENDATDNDFILKSQLKELNAYFSIETKDVQIKFDRLTGTMTVHDIRAGKDVIIEAEPLTYSYLCTQTLHQRHDEYFFGGGMQNGRFSHKGKVIHIECTNVWSDGGVTSPCPFYLSSYGYGVFRNTWQKGRYDFGEIFGEFIRTSHEGTNFDAFFFVNSKPKDILRDYYELTGKPILMPKFAYYPAYLNIFNRDYWVEVDKNTQGAILFEDNKYYISYNPHDLGVKNGALSSLNGEKNNYQFSARAMIDRFKKHDLPLGWFFLNDGYDSRQSESFEYDLKELNEFVEYANDNYIEVALMSDAKLHPLDSLCRKKCERDIRKKIVSCNIVALKNIKRIENDNSFVTRMLEEAAKTFIIEKKESVRPLIVTVNGWAGMQRYASIWSGNQKGRTWENIRLHIPSFIGSGLSGIPVVGSDIDGIFGGGDKNAKIREYQWKAFTPLQFHMDGWSTTSKTPFSFDEEATEINRAYLKLKSILMPYNYSIGYESIDGLPMIRAMFLKFSKEISAYNEVSQYQYMWGPNILVAPIYNNTVDLKQSRHDGIFLPGENQVWIDFFTGEKYQGGKIYKNILTPLWKLPVFIKDGSIIPMANPSNNPKEIYRDERIFTLYPNGETSFDVYEDDGVSLDYKEGYSAVTNIHMKGPEINIKGNLFIKINATTGSYLNMFQERSTILKIMASSDVELIEVFVNSTLIGITKAKSLKEINSYKHCYCFDEKHVINPYLNKYKEKVQQKFLIIKIGSLNITCNTINLKLKGFINYGKIIGNFYIDRTLRPPSYVDIDYDKSTQSNVSLKWEYEHSVDCYEVERDGVVYTNIREKLFSYENFNYHKFRVRSVLNDRCSIWSKEIYNKESVPVFDVKITCNIPSQPGQEIHHLTDGDCQSLWHTDWSENGKASSKNGKFLKLFCDLGDVYEMDRLTYLPREDAGNGLFLEVQYRYSLDSEDWSPFSNILVFAHDNAVKTIKFNGRKIRYVELKVLRTVNDFGSGKQILFFKSNPKLCKEDFSYEILGINISCNLKSQPGQDVCRLTDGNLETLWHTKCDEEGQARPENEKFVKLLCDLGDIYDVDKFTYLPRKDASNGTFLEIQFRHSVDKSDWNTISSPVVLAQDNTLKIFKLNGIKLRYLEITALKTVGNYGSGRQIKFYKII